jgi:hypothetical protein
VNLRSKLLVEVLDDVLQDIVQEEVQKEVQEEVQELTMAPMMVWVSIPAWVAMMEVEEEDVLLAAVYRSLEFVQVQFRQDVAFQVEAVGQEDSERPCRLVLLTPRAVSVRTVSRNTQHTVVITAAIVSEHTAVSVWYQ